MSEAKKRKLAGVKVACLGGEFSLTHNSAAQFFADGGHSNVTIGPFGADTNAVIASVIASGADYGVVPLESSTGGIIPGVYEGLLSQLSNGLAIVAEFAAFDELCLAAAAGVDKKNASSVLCHPQLLAACAGFLSSIDASRAEAGGPKLERVAAPDSSTACQSVATGDARYNNATAIASKKAAERAGLTVLQEQVSDDKNAETRYIVFSKSGADPLGLRGRASDGKKSLIAVALKNVSGSFFKVASCFALRNVDLLKIDSRPASAAWQAGLPTGGAAASELSQHWSQVFFLEFRADASDAVNEAVFNNLAEHCLWVKKFGTYSSALETVTTDRVSWSDVVDGGVLAC